eukprot:6222737-Pyramimonas_sp.AAC.2
MVRTHWSNPATSAAPASSAERSAAAISAATSATLSAVSTAPTSPGVIVGPTAATRECRLPRIAGGPVVASPHWR